MAHHSISVSGCLSRLSGLFRPKALPETGSQQVSPYTRALAIAGAAGLVAANAGFGAIYAWTTGAAYGFGLAALMVVMAVALELCKPLALAAAFKMFRSFSIVRGSALVLFATVAAAYSLTAELSLNATARGDVVAQRAAALKASTDREANHQRERDRRDRASAELASLPSARSPGELQALIDGLLLTPGADGCAIINGRVSSDVCPQVAALRVEKARADHRQELEGIIALPAAANPPGEPQAGPVSVADPAAAALATYLGVLGIVIAPAVLSEWLVLIPVLALEVGSAFAGILVQSVSGTGRQTRNRESAPGPKVAAPQMTQVAHPAKATGSEDAQTREKVKEAIVSQLRSKGGSMRGGERGLAKLIGTNRSTMKRALNCLTMAGVLAVEAGRHGTLLKLVT